MFWLLGALALWLLAKPDKPAALMVASRAPGMTQRAPSIGGRTSAPPGPKTIASSAQRPSTNLATSHGTATAAQPASTAGQRAPATPAPSAPAPSAPADTPAPSAPAPSAPAPPAPEPEPPSSGRYV